MKKIIVILVLAVAIFSCSTYKPASANRAYKPLKSFNLDTLAYLKYDFEENKNYYIGKEIKKLIADCEIYVKTYRADYPMKSDSVSVITMNFLSTKERFIRRENNGKIVSVIVTLENSIPVKEVEEQRKRRRNENPKDPSDNKLLNESFYGGRIIKNIQVFENGSSRGK